MTCLWSSDSFSWQPSDLCSFALLYHISVAVAIKSENNLVYVCQLLHKKKMNLSSCWSHVSTSVHLLLQLSKLSLSLFKHMYFRQYPFLVTIIIYNLFCSPFQSLSAVWTARGGEEEMLYLAAGPLPTLKGSSVILERFWTFFFFPTLQKEVQSSRDHSFE